MPYIWEDGCWETAESETKQCGCGAPLVAVQMHTHKKGKRHLCRAAIARFEAEFGAIDPSLFTVLHD